MKTWRCPSVDNAVVESDRPLDRHRAAVRERLVSAGATRPGPHSVSWRINREVIVTAGWVRAILLQLAHPLVAAGIAEHSSFRRRRTSGLARLLSTIDSMLALTFGTDDEAIEAAARINVIHDRVSGALGEAVGTLRAGERYSAHDPELLAWVHATLLDSILLTYERLVGPLTDDDRDRYCADAAIMEPLLDIPRGRLPRGRAELDATMHAALGSGRIAVSAAGRSLARAILFPPGWWLMWPLFRPLQLLTIGLLPREIREGYGFIWTPGDGRSLARWVRLLRVVRRITPTGLWEWPHGRRRAAPTRATRPSTVRPSSVPTRRMRVS